MSCTKLDGLPLTLDYYMETVCVRPEYIHIWNPIHIVLSLLRVGLYMYLYVVTTKKIKLLKSPNPNIPWNETYSIFTLYIFRCMLVFFVVHIL